MQIASLKVYNPLSGRILYICVPNVPFLWNGPIEDLRSCWDLGDFQRNPTLDGG